MDEKGIRTELANACEAFKQNLKSILQSIKNECQTYGALDEKMKSLQRSILWSGTQLEIAAVECMLQMIEQEKANSEIVRPQ
ncbi:MAG TPA: hypothetical protein GX499_07850 [Clostridiales bacterium]|nr:hypothetical protein [Clostridiales bacterium]